MIPGISGGAAVPRGFGAADLSRTLDALAELLMSSRAQTTQMAEKLLKAGVAQTIQDSAAGSQIDVSA